MGTNIQGEKRLLIIEIQEMIWELSDGKKELLLHKPEGITVLNLQKLHTILKGIKGGVEKINEAGNEWRKTIAESEAKLGALLKG